jgi:hypothetical protein
MALALLLDRQGPASKSTTSWDAYQHHHAPAAHAAELRLCGVERSGERGVSGPLCVHTAEVVGSNPTAHQTKPQVKASALAHHQAPVNG